MSIIDYIIAIIFGIVEGITEWLPVSSTGHMILLDEFLKMNVSEEFFALYLVVIQLGAVMAALILFWKDVWPFGIKDNSVPLKKTGFGRYIKVNSFMMWFKICVACIPAIVVGLLFEDYADAHFYNFYSVALSLLIFGILFIIVEKVICKEKEPIVKSIEEISFVDAIIIGIFQMIAAVFPGVSRSGSTIIGSLLIGIKRETAAKFTFIMAIPVMFGASLLKLVKFKGDINGTELALLGISSLVAFLVSWIIIKKLMAFVRKHDYSIFGLYRILLGIVLIIYFFVNV